jgi:glycerophosphoryl diester phosphodiesterase
LSLDKASLINKAQQKGYGIFFWTINSENEMELLIEKKVDGIITDRPDLLIKVLQKKGLYP